ncbi:dipeptide ABC transporter ATP-binding protein [Pseudomonas sp. LRF_L74]|uniref:dipeptide ABC transporter ATP-binding protein n=1 Tax=Pseudomonas sp. LRF_L74 TaxID=3369422 RepID=UPI003F6132AE
MSVPLLSVQGLQVRLPITAERSHALRDVNFELAAGELLCVVGESGSGKSTLAAALLRLLPEGLEFERGRLVFSGTDLAQLAAPALRKLRGAAIGLVSQEPLTALDPVWRIGQQIDEALRLHRRLARPQRRERVLDLLRYVGLTDVQRIARAYPFQLSGGQRQRAAIAMALACEPRLLIADEPTSALDAASRKQILELLQRIRRETGMAILLITHDFSVVRAVADRVLVMAEGKVVEQGTARQVLHAPREHYTRLLLEASTSRPRPPRPANSATPLLVASGLNKRYWARQGLRRHAVVALQGVELSLRPGETLGIVGESGSGKSTLARALLRLLPLDGGSVRLDGQELLGLGERQLRAVRPGIQMVFQDPSASFNPRRRIGESLIAGSLARGEPRAQAQERARELLGRVGLPASAFEAYPHEFSGGQRQRMAIARALIQQPRVLVADECVSALDALVQDQVLRLLDDLQAQLDLAMLFITHDLGVAARMCDRLVVMRDGQIVESGETARLLAQPRHAYTRTLLDAASETLPARATGDQVT